jgi:hypothetical protein
MATTETLSSNFAGEDAGRFISEGILQAGTVESGAVEFVEGIEYKWNVPNVNLSGIVADATCDFTDSGTITIADRVLTTEEFEVNLELCKKSYRPLWNSISQRAELTPTFTEYLVALVTANIAESRETTIWSGTAATTGEFDGLEVTLALDSGLPAAQEVTGTTVTSANVIAQIESILDATPVKLYQADGYAIRIPTNIAKHYISALAALGYMDRYHVGQTELNFQGVPLLVCPGMTDDVMIATKSDNLFYGMQDYADSEIRVLDMTPIDGSRNVRVAVEWADGVQYGNVVDIVTYGISNLAN